MQFISELHGYPFNTLPRIARVPMPVQSDCIVRGILFCFDVCVCEREMKARKESEWFYDHSFVSTFDLITALREIV